MFTKGHTLSRGKRNRKPSLTTQIDLAMKQLDASLPGLVAKLNELAEKGDREALIYLIDRRMGKPRQQTELDLKGGQEIGAGTMVELFRLISAKRMELEHIETPQLTQGIKEENVQGQGTTEGSGEGGSSQT